MTQPDQQAAPPVEMPNTVVDAGALIRHRPREHYGRRSYWTWCRTVAVDFPKGVPLDTPWVEDCPVCFPNGRDTR